MPHNRNDVDQMVLNLHQELREHPLTLLKPQFLLGYAFQYPELDSRHFSSFVAFVSVLEPLVQLGSLVVLLL
jgi:hypothetical protein